MEQNFWLVVCPINYVKNPIRLWKKWYSEKCVAVGWPPFGSKNPDDGASDSISWKRVRTSLQKMKKGDKIISYLQKWRICLVGVIRDVRWQGTKWYPTVEPEDEFTMNKGNYALGRRILLDWETEGMPPFGYAARIPENMRKQGGAPETRSTIKRIKEQRFNELVKIMKNPCNWVPL